MGIITNLIFENSLSIIDVSDGDKFIKAEQKMFVNILLLTNIVRNPQKLLDLMPDSKIVMFFCSEKFGYRNLCIEYMQRALDVVGINYKRRKNSIIFENGVKFMSISSVRELLGMNVVAGIVDSNVDGIEKIERRIKSRFYKFL